MKRLILFLLSALNLSASNAQTPAQVMVDRMIVELIALNDNYACEKALPKSKEAIELARSIGYQKGLADACVQEGRAYKCDEQFIKAIRSYNEALIIRRDSLDDICGTASIYNNLASAIYNNLYSIGDLDEALTYAKSAVVWGEKGRCSLSKKLSYAINLANAYDMLGFVDSAINLNLQVNRLFDLSKEPLTKGDTLKRIKSSYGLAKRYLYEDVYEKAKLELDTAFSLMAIISKKDRMLFAQLYEARGVLALRSRSANEALPFFQEAEEIYIDLEYDDALLYVYINLAEAHENNGSYKVAKEYYRQALDLADGDPELINMLHTRVDLMIEHQARAQKAEQLAIVLIGLLLIALLAAALFGLLLKKERINAKLKAESHRLKHDIVRNNLLVMDNSIFTNLEELKAHEFSHRFILKMRKKIRMLLVKIGYAEYSHKRPERLKAFVKEMHEIACEAALLEVENYSSLDDVEDYPMSQPLRDELEAIITEAFTNIYKHADCTEAHLLFSVDEDGLGLAIEDNGRGCDVNTIDKSGIDNMKARVDKFKGRFHFKSKPGQGAQIKISILQFPESEEIIPKTEYSL